MRSLSLVLIFFGVFSALSSFGVGYIDSLTSEVKIDGSKIHSQAEFLGAIEKSLQTDIYGTHNLNELYFYLSLTRTHYINIEVRNMPDLKENVGEAGARDIISTLTEAALANSHVKLILNSQN